ncbi:hypothetical protein HRI_004655500 [Hibiscus trionum]|uniref:Agglutinin domain-containing protein n=1 Tax=Hibiscus trionum TaxID=183268 RepID=A0A9W7MLY7_HIBTR|nr:hypothetical protein HRI_004655500 [Hibiscus trionum]
MVLLLPRYIVIKSCNWVNPPDGYLSYIREGGEADGYLRFMEPQLTSPYAKFEVETSKTEGVVHIRSCQNNKYWQRTDLPTVPSGPWIAARSKEKEEDKSKEECTLFKFIPVDPAENTFRIMHVQSGSYVESYGMDNPKFDHGLFSFYTYFNAAPSYVFKYFDWGMSVILPKHVAFKGPNNKYLCLYSDSMPKFGADDIGEPGVGFEIVPANDGKIHIKSSETGKFLRNDWWIWADVTSSDTADTLFRPLKFNDQKIALISLSNNKFCQTFTADGYVNGLSATATSATDETVMEVEERVLRREIYEVKYDVGNSRVYGEAVMVVAQNCASNITEEPSALEVKFEYKETKTSSWKRDLSLKLGMKASVKFKVPLVLDGEVEVSSELQTGVEWGKEFENSIKQESLHKVIVPPMTKVTVNLVASKALCDVPFTYKQRDVLYDGSSVLREVKGGTYVGSNYHRTKFTIKQEKLPPAPDTEH